MKLNTKQAFVNLYGKAIDEIDETTKIKEPLTLGMVLANIVLAPHENKNGFRPLKAYELAQKFMGQKEVELDSSDLIQLKEIVENNKAYITLITAQTIKMLNEVK